jgi:ABC-type cobalamin transport system permease subunit
VNIVLCKTNIFKTLIEHHGPSIGSIPLRSLPEELWSLQSSSSDEPVFTWNCNVSTASSKIVPIVGIFLPNFLHMCTHVSNRRLLFGQTAFLQGSQHHLNNI